MASEHSSCDMEAATSQCMSIIEIIDEDLPVAAMEFGESVREKVVSIMETIETTRRVTPG